MRQTKIIATIGPASRGREILSRLIHAGIDVARLNFSHGTHEQYLDDINAIRELADNAGRHVAILADLQGPKIRLGDIQASGVLLHRGDKFILTTEEVLGTKERSHVNYPNLPRQVFAGTVIYLADGLIGLQVLDVDGEEIICEVMQGGEISSHKGVNIPGMDINEPSLTVKDRIDLEFAISAGVDWIALSFVRSPEDIDDIKAMLSDTGIPVMAKIEKREAVDSITEIIEKADGIMVARGDLGIEIPLEEVPIIQRKVVCMARRAGKPVVIATQMLESMTWQSRPTRAEAADVAHAIFDGADAVMLSNETAVGAFPVEAVETAEKIAIASEKEPDFAELHEEDIPKDITHAISRGAYEVAGTVSAKVIITPTQSGKTPREVAKYRPKMPVIAVCPDKAVLRRLAPIWGVVPLSAPSSETVDGLLDNSVNAAKDAGIVRRGDIAVITGGVLVNVSGTTNMIKVHEI